MKGDHDEQCEKCQLWFPKKALFNLDGAVPQWLCSGCHPGPLGYSAATDAYEIWRNRKPKTPEPVKTWSREAKEADRLEAFGVWAPTGDESFADAIRRMVRILDEMDTFEDILGEAIVSLETEEIRAAWHRQFDCVADYPSMIESLGSIACGWAFAEGLRQGRDRSVLRQLFPNWYIWDAEKRDWVMKEVVRTADPIEWSPEQVEALLALEND